MRRPYSTWLVMHGERVGVHPNYWLRYVNIGHDSRWQSSVVGCAHDPERAPLNSVALCLGASGNSTITIRWWWWWLCALGVCKLRITVVRCYIIWRSHWGLAGICHALTVVPPLLPRWESILEFLGARPTQ